MKLPCNISSAKAVNIPIIFGVDAADVARRGQHEGNTKPGTTARKDQFEGGGGAIARSYIRQSLKSVPAGARKVAELLGTEAL